MPRLSSENHLQRREWFTDLWETSPGQLSLISFVEQRYLHDYFRPEQDWSDAESLAYGSRSPRRSPRCRSVPAVPSNTC